MIHLQLIRETLCYPLSCPLKVAPQDLPDLLLSALRQRWHGSLHRLGRSKRLLGLNVPEEYTRKWIWVLVCVVSVFSLSAAECKDAEITNACVSCSGIFFRERFQPEKWNWRKKRSRTQGRRRGKSQRQRAFLTKPMRYQKTAFLHTCG